jgi:hypothetical protein
VTKRRLTPGEWTVIAATVVLAVASLVTWYTLPRSVLLDAGIRRTFTAWSRGYSPTTLLPLVFGITIAVPTVLGRLADMQLPERIGGIRCTQLRLMIASGAALLSVTEVATQRMYGPVTLTRGPGLWLTLLASCALLVGVVLDHRRTDAPTTPAPTPPDLPGT